MCKFNPKKSRRISRHSSRHRRPHSRKESLQPPTRIQPSDRPPYRGPSLRTLQPTLYRIDRKHRYPHRHPRRTPRRHNRRQTQRARIPIRVLRRQPPLQILVRRKIRRGPRPVSCQRHGAPSEHAPDAPLPVQLPHDVNAARIPRLLAGLELFLALDLQQHFHAFEGGRDERHGDGGEEAGG